MVLMRAGRPLSYVGSKLGRPWPYPLKHLQDVAKEMEGADAKDKDIKHQASLFWAVRMGVRNES